MVTTPREGTFTYDEGTEVILVADAADFGCYRFIEWSGDASTIGNVYGAETAIIMNGDYSITAHFDSYMVSAGAGHTVGLRSNGAVVATGHNVYGQCDVDGWC